MPYGSRSKPKLRPLARRPPLAFAWEDDVDDPVLARLGAMLTVATETPPEPGPESVTLIPCDSRAPARYRNVGFMMW
jgi:hypothetical protein